MAIYNILEMGRSGVLTHQDALQTTSKNISNVNTPGYSRQRPELQSRVPHINFGYRIGGGGVELKDTLRIHDQFIQRQYVEESKNFGKLMAQAESLQRVEGITHHGITDLSNRVTDFFNSFRELSLNPELPALKVTVGESAKTLERGFEKLASSLESMQVELDLRIDASVNSVNLLSKELAGLNEKIAAGHAARNAPHELLDKRDQVVQALSEKLGAQIFTDEKNQINVALPGVGVLVHGERANELEVLRTPASEEKNGGALDIFLKTPFGIHAASRSKMGGELGGLTQVRDETVGRTLKSLDRVAYQFSSAVNQVHREAKGLSWDEFDEGDFFKPIYTEEGAARRLKISDAIEADPENILVGYLDGAPSDNRVALRIADLQDQDLVSLMGDGEEEGVSTFNDALNNMVIRIGSETQGSRTQLEHQGAIMDQLRNYQKSVSGVSLEEEAINLMQFQTAFNAAAKTMQVGDELLETVINLVD